MFSSHTQKMKQGRAGPHPLDSVGFRTGNRFQIFWPSDFEPENMYSCVCRKNQTEIVCRGCVFLHEFLCWFVALLFVVLRIQNPP